DKVTFRPWLRSLLGKTLDGRTLRSTHEQRPNNWGTHAGAARVAIAAYLGDPIETAQAARVFRGYLGDRAFYAGFKYGDLAWQCDPARPVGINPAGCVRYGRSLDGVLPDDQRRSGGFRWPAPQENYAWEGLQGATLQAELLTRAGYPAWTWSNNALLRATKWLYNINSFPATGDDEWQPWLIDERYGTRFATARPARWGKNFGGTDWLYGS
ncbi:MAG TPA: alginate lyase family protein, partial [Actinomycetes bacterium]|nr:alginate lyase family protein [Actinomycetes bacterium]